MNKILTGNSLDVLKTLDSNSIDAIITDPPYGYSFMGKDWDKAVPSVEIWQECLRVLKPGAFCMVMSAPRSDVQMHMISNLEQAGFRIDFTPIYWTYASGFPKAGNIGKLVDKRMGVERENGELLYTSGNPDTSVSLPSGKVFATEPVSDQAKALDGSYAGFQPKPAVEVIIVAMKPLSEKTFVDQALKNGKGITWLDDCRVPYNGQSDWDNTFRPSTNVDRNNWLKDSNKMARRDVIKPQGRFPANLLVSDDVLNDGVERHARGNKNTETRTGGIHGSEWNIGVESEGKAYDSGSYSRYFDLDKWANTLPFLITPKASKSEKNKGLDNFEEKEMGRHQSSLDGGKMLTGSGNERSNAKKNHHPTVKPLKLMSYLITLATRKGDTVLDPFCGSGTTCIAAKELEREYIGIEREQEYVEIAEARLEAVVEDKQVALDVG